MAVVRTGVPAHRVYYAKRELADIPGSQKVTIQFIGAAINSSRNLVVVSSSHEASGWLKRNLAHDGDPTWDINRVTLRPGVTEISPPYKVTRAC
jgi:hypothetical protein